MARISHTIILIINLIFIHAILMFPPSLSLPATHTIIDVGESDGWIYTYRTSQYNQTLVGNENRTGVSLRELAIYVNASREEVNGSDNLLIPNKTLVYFTIYDEPGTDYFGGWALLYQFYDLNNTFRTITYDKLLTRFFCNSGKIYPFEPYGDINWVKANMKDYNYSSGEQEPTGISDLIIGDPENETINNKPALKWSVQNKVYSGSLLPNGTANWQDNASFIQKFTFHFYLNLNYSFNIKIDIDYFNFTFNNFMEGILGNLSSSWQIGDATGDPSSRWTLDGQEIPVGTDIPVSGNASIYKGTNLITQLEFGDSYILNATETKSIYNEAHTLVGEDPNSGEVGNSLIFNQVYLNLNTSHLKNITMDPELRAYYVIKDDITPGLNFINGFPLLFLIMVTFGVVIYLIKKKQYLSN